MSVPECLVLLHHPRDGTPTPRKHASLRHSPRMLIAAPPTPGDAQEGAPDPGAVVPCGDVLARAPGRQNVPGEVLLLSLTPPQTRGAFRRGRPGPAPARPPPLTAKSRRSPGPKRPEENVTLLEAIHRIAVLPT
ncbi:hypothetical protein MRX96_004647 [Rhipicephalus microplus]